MCYIVVKNIDKRGCLALKTKHSKELPILKRKLEAKAKKNVQIVLISRPTAYGEYAPYQFAESENELLSAVENY